VWLSRVDQASPDALPPLRALARQATGRAPVESRHAPVDVVDGALSRGLGLATLHGRRVLLLSGLARPGGFRRTVDGLGAEIAAERAFPDHHRFTPGELAEVLRAAGEARCDLVVTTEKDAVRLPPEVAADPRVVAVRIEAEILAGGEVLDEAIAEALAAFAGAADSTPSATKTAAANATTPTTPTRTATATPTPNRRS
jgi:tetraacyldisaccharide 4'-kinase